VSPTQRTLAWLRSNPECLAEVVEKYNPHAKIRQDLFGCIDIIASTPEFPVIGVQCTSASNFAARLKKVRDSDKAQQLIRNGWQVMVVGWTKGKRGEPRLYAFSGKEGE
jgi:hypothetical protein